MPVKYTPLLLWKFNTVKDIPAEPGIYMIECKATGKRYIGASVNMRRRLYDHISLSTMGRDSQLSQDFKTYGPEAFKVKALEVVKDRSNLPEREKYWFEIMINESASYNTEPPKRNRYW